MTSGNSSTSGEAQPAGHAPRTFRGLPAGVWAMGFASLFMDMSSELIHAVLPLFMVGVLGASMVTVGIVEGVAEATAAMTKIFSGALSDYLRKRKFLMVFGYGLAMLTKPVFPLAHSVQWVFAARLLDRVGKGIRGAPRDALVAELTVLERRGAAYGLRQALDSVGAMLGPLIAIVLMLWLASNIRAVMWFAVVPAIVCVTLLIVFVRDPRPDQAAGAARFPLRISNARRLPLTFWLVVALGAIFTLARFSEAFLVLRAQDTGLSLAWTPMVMVIMNVFYAGAAFPAGAAADRMRPRTLLVIGLALLVAADLMLALAPTANFVLAGAALWGLHMAFTQGLLSKLVADTAPPDLLGTAFGLFNLVSGAALLLSSVIAGTLWSSLGPAATFFAGAVFATIAIFWVLVDIRRR